MLTKENIIFENSCRDRTSVTQFLDPSDQVAIQEDLLELMPGVEEANSISEELDKRVKFEILLVSPQMMGKTNGRTEVMETYRPWN